MAEVVVGDLAAEGRAGLDGEAPVQSGPDAGVADFGARVVRGGEVPRLVEAGPPWSPTQLDVDLARDAAPLVALGNDQSRELLSARVGCAFASVYGMDLGALWQRATQTS